MERRKIFISYAHQDRDWRDLILQHLAPLERWGLVHVWSDARIAAGSGWEGEIGAALDESKVALLCLSPAFLASKYIWEKEIGPILAHADRGMQLVPLVVRPCAWRLAPGLRDLQAYPADGRPMSLGSPAQIDQDLSVFAYQLASLVSDFSAQRASDEYELAQRGRGPAPVARWQPTAAPITANDGTPPATSSVLGRWTGEYRGRYRREPNTYPVVLRVDTMTDGVVVGTMEYPGSTTQTRVEGTVATGSDLEQIRTTLGGPTLEGGTTVCLQFRETEYVTRGNRQVDMTGRYVVLGNHEILYGGWTNNQGELVGRLELAHSR